jgi:hypothetical protein
LYCVHPTSNNLPTPTFKRCFSNYSHLMMLTTILLSISPVFLRWYTHLHYTYMEMFLNFLVLWFWCTLQIFLNANFSFIASHSLFKNCSLHLFISKQLKQWEWHSPQNGTLDSPIHLTPQPL